jgi:signal transduction histidine kinase
LTQDALPVNIDALLIEQVLVNIVKNSVESIVADGEIVISTHQHPATLTVCDNGAGIPEAVSKQLFTPFFTTKKSGQGIGLMFIREVLVAHDCEFSLSTDDDALTRFTIVFKKS